MVKLIWAQQDSLSLQRDWEESDAISGRRLFPGPKLDLHSPPTLNPLRWKFSCKSPTSQMKSGFHPRAAASSLPPGSRVSTPLRGENQGQDQLGHPNVQEPGHQVGHCTTQGDATCLLPLWISRVIRLFWETGSKRL